MTKLEVIKSLKLIKTTVYLGNRKFLDALDCAIELLAQPEPCEDAVSRRKAFEYFVSLWECIGTIMDREEWEDVCKTTASELPSVTPKPEQRWIPCSETVDIPDHEILACDKYGEEMFGYLAYKDEQWLCESDDCVMYDPIAWREKPEPYREEGGE